MERFSTIYSDRLGSIQTEIIVNGTQLILIVEGVKFAANSFDGFKTLDLSNKNSRFTFNNEQELTNCQIISKIPLILIKNFQEIQSTLEIKLSLNSSSDNNGIFSLEFENVKIITKPVFDFESGLEFIKMELPHDYKLKCCFGCAFSDYSVYGNGFFGSMLCFRNIKEQYLMVKDKDEYLNIMDNSDSLVQETYLCDEFLSRPMKIGYRG